jgi:hypothetical protein
MIETSVSHHSSIRTAPMPLDASILMGDALNEAE